MCVIHFEIMQTTFLLIFFWFCFMFPFDASPHQLDQQSSARVSILTINNVLLDNWLMTGQIKL